MISATALDADSRSDSRRNHSAVDDCMADLACHTAAMAAPSTSGAADEATTPFTPGSINSIAALSGEATTTVGVPTAAASTTINPNPSRVDADTTHIARRIDS